MIHKTLLDTELNGDPVPFTVNFTVDPELQHKLEQIKISTSVAPMNLTLSRKAIRELKYRNKGSDSITGGLNHPVISKLKF